MSACKPLGTHMMRFFNTLGAIPGVGTPIGAGRLSIGIILFIISGLGWLLSGCGKFEWCESFNNKCVTLLEQSGFQMIIGFAELFPFFGTAVHLLDDTCEDEGNGKDYQLTYFKRCCT